MEADRDLIVWAAERRILLATPASLIALLRSVSVSWQQQAQTENAQKIAEAAQEFYARVVKFTEHFEKIRAGLERANAAFNDAGSPASKPCTSRRRASRGTGRDEFPERTAGRARSGIDPAVDRFL